MTKIPRYRRKTEESGYRVTGPDVEKASPCYGAAIAFALDHAARTGSTFYVREYGDVVARAEGRPGNEILRAVLIEGRAAA